MATRVEVRIFNRCVYILFASALQQKSRTHLQLSKCQDGAAHGKELQATW